MTYERERSDGAHEPLSCTLDFVGYDGSESSYTSSTKSLEGETRWMKDYVSSNYLERSGRGEIVNNGMHSSKELRTASATTLITSEFLGGSNYNSYTFKNGWYLLRRNPITHEAINIDIDQLKTLAGTSAHASISAPEFQGLVFLAELRETLRFIRSPLASITNTVKRAKRNARRQKKAFSKLSKAKRQRIARSGRYSDTYQNKLVNGELALTDFMSANWLTYRYGIVPMQHDVLDFASAITLKAAPVDRKTARGYAYNSDTSTNDLYSTPSHLLVHKQVKTHRLVEVRAGVLYSWTHTDTFGMNLRELPGALWEAVPFSFMADWAINLADWVRAVTPKIGVVRHADWTSVKDVTYTESVGQVTGTDTPGQILSWDVTTPSSSFETLRSEEKVREPGTNIGFATYPIPFDGDLGTKRLIDTASILHQLLLSKI